MVVFQTPISGTVLYTTTGAIAATGDRRGNPVPLTNLKTYNALVDPKTGTSIITASKIPGTKGSPPRFLLLMLKQKDGVRSMATYDTFTDTVFSNNNTAAATTHYMLAYTWGECSGNLTKGLVDLTFSSDYSNECQLPKTGLYYQSPNQYFVIPYSCLGVPYDKLLTDCPEVKANMKSLVDSTCAASIPKVCQQQYDFNPPFACVSKSYASPLTVISLSFSNTNLLFAILTVLVTAALTRMHKNYRPTSADLFLSNPPPVHGGNKGGGDASKAFGDVEMTSSSSSSAIKAAPGGIESVRDELLLRLQMSEQKRVASEQKLGREIASLRALVERLDPTGASSSPNPNPNPNPNPSLSRLSFSRDRDRGRDRDSVGSVVYDENPLHQRHHNRESLRRLSVASPSLSAAGQQQQQPSEERRLSTSRSPSFSSSRKI